MCKRIREDIAAVRQRDPAARSGFEILLMYAGVHALFWHRPAHWLYRHHCFFLARLVSQLTRFFTGIEIHPGAVIGHNVFIDHGSGIVIGETAEVGDGCTLYQGVTLGGTGKDTGKRHPTLGRNVMVGCGAKVLGPVRVGDNCKIAANAVLLHSIDADSTAVGVPARVVRVSNVRCWRPSWKRKRKNSRCFISFLIFAWRQLCFYSAYGFINPAEKQPTTCPVTI